MVYDELVTRVVHEEGMPVSHQFGGEWTEEKLERLGKYLRAYTTIFTSNERAKFFTTTYVDAFAGTGYRTASRTDDDSVGLFDEEAQAFKSGSARIALETDPPFDRYLFIERNPDHVAELEKLKQQFTDRSASVTIEQGEANAALLQWCENTDWRTNRAVVFLDAYGMQVNWATLKALAETVGVDLWLLFPLGQAVNRLLTRKGPPPEHWAAALERIFGTDEWREAFYKPRAQGTLFGIEEGVTKDADFDAISKFFVERLKSIFTSVAENPLPLRNSHNTPIYLLCFAAGNPKGATTALKIAQDILRM